MALLRRVQQPDVVLYVNDVSHGFVSIADTVRTMKVPVLDLQPTFQKEFRSHAGLLESWFSLFGQIPPHLYVPPPEEPEWKAVRDADAELPKEHCAIIYKPLVEHLPDLAEGGSMKIIGPIYGSIDGKFVEKQALALEETGLKEWLESDSLPVVYMSMGSHLRDDTFLPGAMVRITEAFSGDGSSYRLLVSFGKNLGAGFGDHVRFESWVPQYAVLSHPSVKAFVTHGGANSAHEGIYHGKPFIVIPCFDDQRYHGPRLKELGLASDCLSPLTVTAVEAATAVAAVLQPCFQERAREASEKAKAMGGLQELERAAMNLIQWAESHPPTPVV